jgi:hypothetical protein
MCPVNGAFTHVGIFSKTTLRYKRGDLIFFGQVISSKEGRSVAAATTTDRSTK